MKNTFRQAIARKALSWLVDAANWKQRERRPYEPVTSGPLHKEVSASDRIQLESDSAKLYWNLGPAKGMIDDKAIYSVGRAWLPLFKGEDKEWGKVAREWLLDQWYPLADISGHDFQTHLYLASVSIDRDGGVFPMLTEYETGFPSVQSLPSRMICSDGDEKVLEKGPYKGLRIYDGVIVNKVGTPVAYKVKISDDKWEYYSARDLCNLYDPVQVDQLRGLPAFTHAILDLKNLRQVQEYEMLASALASSIGLIEHNEQGMADPTDPMNALAPKQVFGSVPTGPNPVNTQEMFGGMVKYFRANSGSKIDTFKNDRPGEAWQKLQDRLIRNAATGASWPYEMAWDISALGGANTRLIIAKAQRSIEDRQDLLRPYAKRAVGYAIAKAIKLGILPQSDDWWKWGFTMPSRITADYGREQQADREDYFAGLRSMTSILGEEGIDINDHIAELKAERELMESNGIDIKTSKQVEGDKAVDIEKPEMPDDDEEEKKAAAERRHAELFAMASRQPNVTVNPPNVNVQMPDVRVNPHFDIPAPNVTVEPATVNVNVPEQPPANIKVEVPQQQPPVVNVAAAEPPPAPVVNVAAPNVEVNLPAVNAAISLKRNKDGLLESARIDKE